MQTRSQESPKLARLQKTAKVVLVRKFKAQPEIAFFKNSLPAARASWRAAVALNCRKGHTWLDDGKDLDNGEDSVHTFTQAWP